jgi:hypothetical protein
MYLEDFLRSMHCKNFDLVFVCGSLKTGNLLAIATSGSGLHNKYLA